MNICFFCFRPVAEHTPVVAQAHRLMADHDAIVSDMTSGVIGLEGYRVRRRAFDAAVSASHALVQRELIAMFTERIEAARGIRHGRSLAASAMGYADEAEAQQEDERDHRRWLDNEDERKVH